MYQWRQVTYLGAAHGLCGILYVLLDVPEIRADKEAIEDILRSIDCFMAIRLPSGNYQPARKIDNFILQFCLKM